MAPARGLHDGKPPTECTCWASKPRRETIPAARFDAREDPNKTNEYGQYDSTHGMRPERKAHRGDKHAQQHVGDRFAESIKPEVVCTVSRGQEGNGTTHGGTMPSRGESEYQRGAHDAKYRNIKHQSASVRPTTGAIART